MLLFWDASALAKRYFVEDGSPTVNELFAAAPARDMASAPWSYAETFSILLRRYNSGVIDALLFANAVTLLRAETVDNTDFTLLSIDDVIVFGSLAIMQCHNLNATDAALLYLLLTTLPTPLPSDFVLIASDKRLLRAANAEGMKTLDPTQISAQDVAAFLARL